MDLAAAVRIVLHRWLILVIGLVATLGGVAYVYQTTPLSYQSNAQIMVLLPPTASSAEFNVSPFLYLPNGVSVLARVVSLVPATDQFRADMIADGFHSQYELRLDTQAPIVSISVEGADAEDVLATRDELIVRFGDELQRVQQEEGVPTRQFAHVRTLQASSAAEPVTGDRFRAAAVAAAIGAVVTLVAIFVIDRALRDRPRRRKRAGKIADGTASLVPEESPATDEAGDSGDGEPATVVDSGDQESPDATQEEPPAADDRAEPSDSDDTGTAEDSDSDDTQAADSGAGPAVTEPAGSGRHDESRSV